MGNDLSERANFNALLRGGSRHHRDGLVTRLERVSAQVTEVTLSKDDLASLLRATSALVQLLEDHVSS